MHGRWQEDIEPLDGTTARDRDQMKRFGELMREFERTGQFTVPMATGAKPSPLDRISMRDWIRQNGFDSPYLNWYVNYACRDEYGGSMDNISAWAGIYYFAAHAEQDDKGPITQPEGNGWIVKKLVAKLNRYIQLEFAGRRNSQTGPKAPGDHTGSGICLRHRHLLGAIDAGEVPPGGCAAGCDSNTHHG